MTQVILQPATSKGSREHLEDTIHTPVSLERIRRIPNLAAEDIAALENLDDGAGLPIWGAMPGERGQNLKRWQRMAPGDVVIFTVKRDEILVGTVAYKVRNETLAEELWGRGATANGVDQTWECMFVVVDLDRRPFDLEAFNHAVGRKPNALIREFIILNEEQGARALNYLALPTGPVTHGPTPPRVRPARRDPAAAERALTALEEIDASRTAKVRAEQGLLRDYLLDGETGDCALCGRTFPIQFLVVAHIKKRSECTEEEKRDFDNVVMPNCTFGCDELFERGYIGVDADGQIVVSDQAPEPGPVHNYIGQWFQDRRCEFWVAHPGSHAYFAHRLESLKQGVPVG